MKLAIAAVLTFSSPAVGEWTQGSVNGRNYMKYKPAGHVPADDGLMVFLHGVGGSAQGMIGSGPGSYDVAYWAERFGFLAIVPDGSKNKGPGYKWNMDPSTCRDLADTSCNDVQHVLDILTQDTDADAVDGPKIALGFSNGAGMASMMGCHDSTGVYVAHVAVHIDPNANFTEACAGNLLTKRLRRRLNPDEEVWYAVGESDGFLADFPDPMYLGVVDQFDTFCSGTPTVPVDCPSSSTGCTTYECQECDEGELCIYFDNLGHEMAPSMTYQAWTYLNGTAAQCTDSCSANPNPNPGPGPGTGSPTAAPGGCTSGEGVPCSNNGPDCCKGTLRCFGGQEKTCVNK